MTGERLAMMMIDVGIWREIDYETRVDVLAGGGDWRRRSSTATGHRTPAGKSGGGGGYRGRVVRRERHRTAGPDVGVGHRGHGDGSAGVR